MGPFSVYVAKSNIHGNGVHSTDRVPPGVTLFRVTDHFQKGEEAFNYLTLLGHRINHSFTPNSRLFKKHNFKGTAFYLATTKQVESGEELTVDYNTLQPDFGRAEPHYK